MTKKRLLLALALLAGVSLTTFVARCLKPVRFTEEMANRIHRGMTEAEVVAILGKPAGDYSTTTEGHLLEPNDYRTDVWLTPEGRRHPDGKIEKAWISDEGGVEVEFDAEGRVLGVWWEGYWRPEPKFRDYFRRAMRLLFG